MKRFVWLVILLATAGCASNRQATVLHTQAITWGDIQTAADQPPDQWDWSGVDAALAEQTDSVIVPIYPYALWDQATCHVDWPSVVTIFNPNFQAPYPPCDETAYAAWVKALVTRYHGQVTAWQILAVPTDQDPPTAQWIGGANSYAELVMLTAQVIHQADNNVPVYIGELNNLQPEAITFYAELLGRADVQGAVSGLTIDADTVTDHGAVESLLDRAHWDRPADWVYTKS